MLHLAQNAHYGRRLYTEHGVDGECCTLWLEHISFMHYAHKIKKTPARFKNLQLTAPW